MVNRERSERRGHRPPLAPLLAQVGIVRGQSPDVVAEMQQEFRARIEAADLLCECAEPIRLHAPSQGCGVPQHHKAPVGLL